MPAAMTMGTAHLFQAPLKRGGETIQRLTQWWEARRRRAGEVWLVGAGPGDPGLLTVNAVRALERAQIVLHDSLIAPDVLALAPRRAKRIHVGKRCGNHRTRQAVIHRLMRRYAAAGYRVVRLKGGDPFVFGRGGEELQAMATAGVTCHVIPGITAATGCAAYAGIPLTHRDYAHSVQFVTARFGREGDEPDWSALARPGHTLVFYMGGRRLGLLARRLLRSGRGSDCPVAIIRDGTGPNQAVRLTTLRGLLSESPEPPDAGAILTIVGEVVALHPQWRSPACASANATAPSRRPCATDRLALS